MKPRLVALLAFTSLACTRAAPTASPGDASTDAGRAAGPAPRATDAPREDTPETFGEARHASLASLDDEPMLARNADAIRAHFGGALPARMALQAVPLAGGAQAMLLETAAADAPPVALLVDATGAPAWIKDHPVGGLTPPVTSLAIAPRPDDGVALFFFDVPTALAGVRMWNADGSPFADLQILRLEKCDALDVAWWKGRGWIVIASTPSGAIAQLLRETGSVAWGDGIPIGAPIPVEPGAAIAIDTDASFVIVQRAKRAGATRAIATRYDPRAVPAWTKPVDLGVARGPVDAARDRAGVTRVTLGDRAVTLRADGTLAR
jgi:hypothetical protein